MKNSANKNKQHLLGRNLFTLVVFLPITIILLLTVFVAINYISVYNSSKVQPFLDKTVDTEYTESDYKINDLKRMKAKDFDDFGVIFTCTSYSEDENNAKFELRTYKNENSVDIIETMTANVCVSANWISFIAYGSKTTTLKLASDQATAEGSTTYRKTFTVSIPNETFPSKANTWPVKVTVSKPKYYVYLQWTYYADGKAVTDAVVLEYNYDDILPQTGGIRG